MIEFEREWQGGSKPYVANPDDIVSFEPIDGDRTLVYLRGRGEIVALLSFTRFRRLVSLVRLASTIQGDV